MTTPVVSVIMAVFDGAPWVGGAIESLLAQTLADLEVIVIDDGSTDATAEVLAAFVDPRLRVERRARAGLTHSLNRALEISRAPLVARLDGGADPRCPVEDRHDHGHDRHRHCSPFRRASSRGTRHAH